MLAKLSPEHLETQSNANKTSKKLDMPDKIIKSKSPLHSKRKLELVNSDDFEQGIQLQIRDQAHKAQELPAEKKSEENPQGQ